VRADHVPLKLIEIFAPNSHIGEQADSGIYGVNGSIARCQTLDEIPRAQHPLACGGIQLYFGSAGARYGANVRDGKMMTVDVDGH
jgi:hypothetical protein